MLRAQSTPEGMQGIYVALPEGDNPAAAFALKLDAQGREIQRQPLNRAGGTVRFIAPPPESGRGGPAPPAGRGGGRAGGGRGFGPAALPPDSPYIRPAYAYQPDERNPLEIILDANYLRVGSTMDRRAEAPTVRPTRTSQSTAPWRFT
jgi:hypothetical protein